MKSFLPACVRCPCSFQFLYDDEKMRIVACCSEGRQVSMWVEYVNKFCNLYQMFHIFLKYLLPLLHFFRYGHGRSLCFSLLSFNESIVAA